MIEPRMVRFDTRKWRFVSETAVEDGKEFLSPDRPY